MFQNNSVSLSSMAAGLITPKLRGLCHIWAERKRTSQNKTVQTTVEYSPQFL